MSVVPAGRVGPELVEAYREIAPGTLGHLTGLRFMDSGLHPVFEGCRLVGPAVTVWAPAGLDLGILAAAEALILEPGDVVVVDRGGDTEHACLGEFRAIKSLGAGPPAGWWTARCATSGPSGASASRCSAARCRPGWPRPSTWRGR